MSWARASLPDPRGSEKGGPLTDGERPRHDVRVDVADEAVGPCLDGRHLVRLGGDAREDGALEDRGVIRVEDVDVVRNTRVVILELDGEGAVGGCTELIRRELDALCGDLEGVASGTLMTSMLKSAVFGSFCGVSPEHPASSSF